jgi:SSS family solute:Na+ symporter
MHWIDWLLVIIPIVFVLGVAAYTKRYVRSVADFLSGGRCAGRYLLANARGESDSGLANTMSKFEIVMVSGFVLNFWEKVSVPVLLLIGITGFVVYRFRETRAMTLAQFFEQRYSRNYRLFMGTLAFISGILNYGIFPAISSRFFIYFLGLPLHVPIFGFDVPTFTLIMGAYLTATVLMILVGGQVTLMVTDCIEGILSHGIYILIVISVFLIVGWDHIVEVMSSTPVNKSLINPFDAHDIEDFNIWFVLMAMLMSVYTTMALQNKQGFNSAARTPHESRMGHVLGHWRGYARILMLLALGLCVTTYIRHPDFADKAKPIQQQIAQIDQHKITAPITDTPGSQAWFADKSVPQLQKQMTAPVALSHLLPTGIKGLFVAIMIMGLVAGDSGHMHSWGSIFVQDVILPLRKKPMSPTGHIWALRLSIIGVAAFAFVFSIVYAQSQYIALWWALTAGVFVGGAGAAIIGGLYWKRGTAAGAWSATITGSTIALIGIAASSSQFWPTLRSAGLGLGLAMPKAFWFNGQQMAFFAACLAVVVYVVVSLLTSRGREFDLNHMLHRDLANPVSGKEALTLRDRFRLKNILKFDDNFTLADKLVSGGIFWWSMLLLAVNLVVTVWNLLLGHWPTSWWATYWMITGIALPFVIALVTLVWFGIGGVVDIRRFFRDLSTMKRDDADDGRVDLAPLPPGGAPAEVSPLQTATDLAAGTRAVASPATR